MAYGSPHTPVRIMSNLRQRLGRVGKIAAMVERETLVVFMSMMVVVVFFGILVRYTPIAGKTLWTVELARILLLCAAFWAAGSVESFNGHFRLAVFEELVKGKCQLLVQLFG